MAVTALSGQRWQGSGTATKDPADFEETFSSTGHTSDDTTVSGWYTNDISGLKYDASNDNLKFDITGSADDVMYYDLQHADALNGSNANATTWTLRMKINVTTRSGTTENGNQFVIGMSASNAFAGSRDFMGVEIIQGSDRSPDVNGICNATVDNGVPQNQLSDSKLLGSTNITMATGTDWWLDITRDGDDCICTLYEDEFSGTSYTKTLDVANITDLRYIFLGSYSTETTFVGTIDDIKFYDGGMTEDDKTTVTDVPAGSEFEQTDDYKTYQRSAEVSVWSQILSSSYSQVNNTNTSEDTRMGQQFESGHANIGKTFDTVTIRLRNPYSDSSTYEIPMKVWLNGSTSSSHTSETTVTLDELQTGTTWDASAPYDDAVTYTFATPITIGTNDIIGIQPSGGTFDSSSVIIREKNLAEADTKMISYRSGAWGTIFDNEDLYMTISLSPRWVERGTAI